MLSRICQIVTPMFLQIHAARITDGHLRPPRVGGDHRQGELRKFQTVQRGAEGA